MNERSIERERVETVFGVHGDLHEKHADFPDEWDGIFAWWREGAPYYAYLEDDHNMRTVYIEDAPYGYGAHNDPPGWKRVAVYGSSGEAQCGCVDFEEMETSDCPLCEGDGYIYLGSACEVVYERVP